MYNTHLFPYNEDYFDKLPNVKKQIKIDNSFNNTVTNFYETFFNQLTSLFISGIFYILQDPKHTATVPVNIFENGVGCSIGINSFYDQGGGHLKIF